LGFYGVSDGGEILMNELNLDIVERAEKLKAEDHKKRVLEQEHEISAMQELQKGLRKQGLL
jgi:hypothetical protein